MKLKLVSKTVWVICDTQGGRNEPFPLLRHVYDSPALAKQHQTYHFNGSQEYYPILPMVLKFKENDKEQELKDWLVDAERLITEYPEVKEKIKTFLNEVD